MQSAAECRLTNPVILDVGPGGMSRIGRWLHPIGPGGGWNGVERFRCKAARLADNIARSNPFGRVSCPEVEEVYQTSMALNPRKIVVIDLQQKVLDAGRRFARLLEREELFEFRQLDLVNSPIGLSADIVICYSVIGRASDRAAALGNICSAVRPGGLFSFGEEKALPGFVQLSPSLFRKNEAGK